jgi:type I restriction enzyme S subunit
LERWSVRSFFEIAWHWPRAVIKALGHALDKRVEIVNRDEHDFDSLRLVTLHFDGEMEPRDLRGQNHFKGRLFFAQPGDVIYSKIDVRNGAIGVVSAEMGKVAVSSEYPVYRIRPEIAAPEYVKLLFRTSFFRHAINSMISGASGRKRVQPSQVERIEIPLPPLSVQRAIVARWRAARESIDKANERIARIEKETHAQFLTELGLTLPERATPRKAFAVHWEGFDRWSVSYNQAAASLADLTRGKYAVVGLGSILDMVQYGTSEKANTTAKGTPILRINNVKDGRIDTSDLKHIFLSKKTVDGLRLSDGDILIIRTSGSRDLVGTCAVFHEEGDFIFASYLIRLRPSPETANSDFIAWYINSPVGRQQVDSLSRQIMQNNINSHELRSLRLPLPLLEVQSAIMARVSAGRAEIAREREVADRLRCQVRTEVEEMILGTRPVKC